MHIDDEESFTELSRLILKKIDNNINIITFTSSIQALHYIVTHISEISAIISDFQMPNMNGIELLQEIREINSKIPFIMLSGMKKDKMFPYISMLGNNNFYIEKTPDIMLTFKKIYQILCPTNTLYASNK